MLSTIPLAATLALAASVFASPYPFGNSTLNGTSTNATNVIATYFNRTLPPPVAVGASETLFETLARDSACYTESTLSRAYKVDRISAGRTDEFNDDCHDFKPGNYQFVICKGRARYAMQCNVTEPGEYDWRVIGDAEYDLSGCVGTRCKPAHCAGLKKNMILSSTKLQPDALMLVETTYKLHYPTQLRTRLEQEGFVLHSALESRIEQSWCDNHAIMSVTKTGVRRGHLAVMGAQCDVHGACNLPGPGTLRTVRDILETEYPVVEIGLSIGLPIAMVVIVVALGLYLFDTRRRSRRMQPPQGAAEQNVSGNGEVYDRLSARKRQVGRSGKSIVRVDTHGLARPRINHARPGSPARRWMV